MAVNPPVDQYGYKWRYILNIALVCLAFLAVICNVIVTVVPNGDWLGLTDVQWHWVLAVSAIVMALNTAFNRTPMVQAPPTASRIAVENQVQEMRKSA